MPPSSINGSISSDRTTRDSFALLSIRLVKYLVTSDKFRVFAWYTLILGIVVLGIGLVEHFTGHAIQGYLSSVMAVFVTVG